MAASGLPASARLAFTPHSRARRAMAAATSCGKPKSRSRPETSKVTVSVPVGKATSAQSDGQASDPNKYFVDTLFRSDRPASETTDASIRAEAGSIFANALRQKDVPAPDKTYLGQLVAARTGLSQTDAEQRVSDVLSQARQAADTARKTVAHSLYWTFLALLIGAFCASFAATIGGKQRDHVVTI